ncbi:MAG TPA: LPXTG cell wall anchor domain-containing protein [Feifaniaceae bacterium]|nr:LPXTG cell wall anchor domain-containing protein [Feifaniaceae bacterium]
MKRTRSLKLLATAAISLLLLFCFAATASAADSSGVTYTGYAGSLYGFVPDGGASGNGLFPGLQNLMPGGTYTQEIKVQNSSRDRIELFLQGEAASQNTEAGRLLLDAVTFSLAGPDGPIVGAGTPAGASWPENGRYMHLGRFYPGQEATLTLTMTVPANLDNTFRNAAGKVDWTFQADVYVDDDDDDGPRRTPLIPLGPGVVITVDENQIPLAPGTGDDANPLLWGGLFAAFAVLLAVLLIRKRRGRV